MSFETPGDGIRCDHCNAKGHPYEYRGITFSGLTPNRGEQLCSQCLDRAVDTDGVNIHVTDRGGVDYVHNTVRDRHYITARGAR